MRRSEEEEVAKEKALRFGLNYINLTGYPLVPDVIRIISKEDAEALGLIPYVRAGKKLRVAVLRPEDQQVQQKLQEMANGLGYEISVSLCSESSLRSALKQYDLVNKQAEKIDSVSLTNEQTQLAINNLNNKAAVQDSIRRGSVSSAFDVLLAGAIGMEASDIHLEPTATSVRVRYRMDGVLDDIVEITPAMGHALDSRIRVMASLKLDSTKTPQDGRFSVKVGGQDLDIRVSILPTPYGSIIVLRLLNFKAALVDLAQLGLRADAVSAIEEAIARPHGLILNTGPTGSGKTTTMYAILTRLNKPGVKIVTIEDPIEYHLSGVDQVQVVADKGLTFADALRSVLRQDPDIIMVGEIRDLETAEICIQASITGHLVLSTLHTNNAPSAIPRLLDMGVKPYLLAGAASLIIAQRLVRKLVPGSNPAVPQYKGRVGLIEYIKPDADFDKLILSGSSIRQFQDLAIKKGMITMQQDGMSKVKDKITTEQEVKRVTADY